MGEIETFIHSRHASNRPTGKSFWVMHIACEPSLRLCDSSGLAAECIEALSNPPSPTELIFPNLRVVGLHGPQATILPLVRHLANPKLTSISFGFVEELGAAIATFGERCPVVTNFDFSEPPHANTTSGLICRWQNLCSVRCYDVSLNIDTVLHLSCLHYLRYMGFKVQDAVVDRIHTILFSGSMLTFPALEHLGLTSGCLTPICRLLRHLRTPEVHDVSVNVDARPTAPDLVAFLMSLQEACTHASLNNFLFFVDCIDNEQSGVPLENTALYHITFKHLRPLTAFRNIKSIRFYMPCGVHLNERELLRLASSWLHLEVFQTAVEDHDWPETSAITPGGFLQLLERYRSLRVLSFMFDCRGYTEVPQGHPWRGLTMPKDSSIHLLSSPIEEESVRALSVFFPRCPLPVFRSDYRLGRSHSPS
ncbi:hypothetical protein HD554DRAFT_1150336 [Boletus coccyginus]|nr:hypothetical protein HD554DRAFT_1150336 [Boletus coccyginus]